MQKLLASSLASWLVLTTFAARAQYYEFTSALNPYSQNFNGMGTDTAVFKNGLRSSLKGIICGYRGYNSSTSTYVFAGVPSPVKANDGSTSTSAAYNFGTAGAADRALGGIAGGSGSSAGVGYVCVRLRNSSGVTIQNLDVRYAIEQWYNTANASEAYFRASYRQYSNTTSFTNNDIVDDTNWTAVADLDLAAPATGGILGKADGNSTTYRSTAQKRLLGLNIANGAEIVIRLKYIFNSTTNGNGISVDDMVIYPETNVLYSKTTGNLDNTSNWGQSTDGTNPPAAGVDFAAANVTYIVQGTNRSAESRLSSSGWNVSGTNSRVVVGTDTAPAFFSIVSGDKLTATLDVSNKSTLNIADALSGSSTNVQLTVGSLAKGSMVRYTATAAQDVLAGTYSSLMLAGGNSKFPRGNVTVADTLNLSRPLVLGTYNLALLRNSTLTRAPNGQVQATGTGSVRRTVLAGAATGLLFPLALSAATTDYLPVTITSGSSDKDETYRAQAVANIYTTYGTTGTTPATYANTAGATTAPTTGNLNATWYIGHETATTVAATLQVGWVGGGSREGTRFATQRSQAYLDHYTSSSNTWDASPANQGASGSDVLWTVARTGVSSFSPFAVTSNTAGPLPVTLVAFAARRVGSTVACTWSTASEVQNDHFEVERSLDGVSFATLGQVPGHGSSTVAQTYTFVDQQPTATVAYYRLRQVDVNGPATYSPIVAVAGSAAADAPVAAVALPNPSSGEFMLQTAFTRAAPVQATVLNVLGQPVLHVTQLLPAGPAGLPLDLRTQPTGLYLVQLLGPGGTQTLRLLKQ